MFDDRDIDGEFAVAADEFAGAVERVHEREAMPVFGHAAFTGLLFGNHHQARISFCQRIQNERFGFLVCCGYRRGIALLVDVKIAFVDIHDHGASLEGDPGKRVSCDGHSISPGWACA